MIVSALGLYFSTPLIVQACERSYRQFSVAANSTINLYFQTFEASEDQ